MSQIIDMESIAYSYKYYTTSFYAAIALVVSSFILVPFIFGLIVPFSLIKENLLFTFLALSSAMLPMLGISKFSYEFPSLLGGIIGMGITAVLVRFNVGLKPVEPKLTMSISVGDLNVDSERHVLDIEPFSERSVVHPDSPFMSSKTELPLTVDEENSNVNYVSEVLHGEEGVDDEEYAPLNTTNVSEGGPRESSVRFSLLEDDGDDNASQNTPRSSNVGLSSTSIDDLTDSQRAIEMAIGPRDKKGWAYIKEFLLRTSPITLTVILLIITRIPQIGLNDLLKQTSPNFSIYFGTYAIFRLSASLVFQLEDILTYPGLNFKYELLYTPFIIPFVLVSVITYLMYRKESSDTLGGIFGTVISRVKTPAIALAGALTLVQLMTTGDEAAPASIIGIVLSDALKGGWITIAGSIGALGSFFSGSTTVSNLTFGSVQKLAAENIGKSVNAMLALQVVGASAGNGICLNNIISACAITGLAISEGKIIAKTAKFVLIMIVISTLVLLPFLFE